MKWKRGELIWYWADCMTLPFDHIHDLDLRVEISRSQSEIHVALSQDWDGRLTWNEKDMSHPFMTMILTSLTMVAWADVLDSDWGDFRRRRAVDISSYLSLLLLLLFVVFLRLRNNDQYLNKQIMTLFCSLSYFYMTFTTISVWLVPYSSYPTISFPMWSVRPAAIAGIPI